MTEGFSPYENFMRALDNKSLDTKQTYIKEFNRFKIYCQQEPHVLVQQQKVDLENRIRAFLDNLKQVGLSYSTINKAYWAVRTFFVANRVGIDWAWVDTFKPKREEKEQQVDRPYTQEEISNMMAATDDLRTILALLIMASGGPRKGALPGIRIDKDLLWLDQYDLYAICFYPLDKDHRYYSFISPQASQFLDEYKGNRKTGFLFINKRDSDLPITDDAIVKDVWQVAVKSGVRVLNTDKSRHEVQLDHGLRKFFRTQLEINGINEGHAERLMGHGKPLVKTYSMPSMHEWMQICRYDTAIQSLTF